MKILFIHDDSNKNLGSVHDLDENRLDISSMVGGWFDCVRNADGSLVGYVNDTGLIDGLPANVTASMVFGRPLYGPCVIVGGLNDDGEYDGETHPVPDKVIRLVLSTNETYSLRPDPIPV